MSGEVPGQGVGRLGVTAVAVALLLCHPTGDTGEPYARRAVDDEIR